MRWKDGFKLIFKNIHTHVNLWNDVHSQLPIIYMGEGSFFKISLYLVYSSETNIELNSMVHI